MKKVDLQVPASSVALSYDGKRMIVGAPARSLLFDLSIVGGRPKASRALELEGTPEAGQVAFSADGANVAIIGHHKNVTLCSASTGATLRRQRRDERVHCVALDHDGRSAPCFMAGPEQGAA